ncbi:DUF411 domain-containing protein [Sulfurisoma sediminicola]|uniref:Metal-binding protein n=1 Tax=Sulfurisoma sediminicola TaxID=1381557 RepID=A0A497X973_9PROT|nr:DUF411 domain-containing protein [Sulfurisoma sediminicola]RLJ62750.1 hypothetical protein DFR35_2566 [Sulfurisoma sediminicola]
MSLRLALAAALSFALAAHAETRPRIEVFMPSPCLACIEWGVHLMDNGFAVTYRDTADMAALKRRLKVPAAVQSVPTATVDGYFVEGHVPAEDIMTLLAERPKARGLAVPGLPRGAPGREDRSRSCETGCVVLDGEGGAEQRHELFETLLVMPDGQTRRWARH